MSTHDSAIDQLRARIHGRIRIRARARYVAAVALLALMGGAVLEVATHATPETRLASR